MTTTLARPRDWNYYAGNPLNRLSYLRSSKAFLASALESPRSRFLLYDNLSPLVSSPDAGSKQKRLLSVGWQDVRSYIAGQDGSGEAVFRGVDGKDQQGLGVVPEYALPAEHQGSDKGDVAQLTSKEKRHFFINQPALVFLGVDESGAPAEQRSLPVSKPTDNSTLESHSPHGVPFWAFDVSKLDDLKKRVLDKHVGSEFTDMRAGMQTIPAEDAAIGGEGRALLDWNRRNLFCPACGSALRSVWAGWKRTCIPGLADDKDEDVDAPACVSKKGVHNFNYPRTDPVVIMAITTPDRDKILLGRQKSWPPKFYSCLAGFIESGETIEEAVRREVYEEAGVQVGEVFYHSSQPWPYPSSLMIGAIGVAKDSSQQIRCDLDNELDDARWYTRAEVQAVLDSSKPLQLSKEEVARIDDKDETPRGVEQGKAGGGEEGWFRMPPATAIANTLVQAWAANDYFGATPSQSTSNKL